MHTRRYATTRLVVLGLAFHAPLLAQTRFDWPDTTVDVGRYTNVDECLAATHRIEFGIENAAWTPVWRDTMPDDAERHVAPLSAPVTQSAQRCAARFDARTVSLGDFASLAKLYLQAGRDTDVAEILARRLKEIGESRQVDRAMVLDTVFHLYLTAQPARLDPAERVLQRSEWAARNRFVRLDASVSLAAGAITTGDTARAMRVGRELFARIDSLTPAERNSAAFQTSSARQAIFLFFLMSAKDQLLDSLHRSTAAYLRAVRGMWARTSGRTPESLPVIGAHAPPIAGAFWVPSDSAHRPRPTLGRVSLVVFASAPSCFNIFELTVDLGDLSAVQNDGGCFANAAALHRLAQRFPELEITIVSRTAGNVFGYLPPLSPTETAEWLERAAAAWKLPGALAIVAQSPTVRLPAPDDRIVESSTDSNLVRYHFGDGYEKQELNTAFLVDQNGVIVWQVGGGIGFGESRDVFRSTWVPMIDVLLHRQRTDAATPSLTPTAEHF